MRTALRRAAVLGVLAGCYGPVVPEGAPCQTTEQCPAPQRCVLGSCSLHAAPPIDARLPGPDAPNEPMNDASIDAPPPPVDAMRLACSTAGLACAGTATTFPCGGNCWVLCSGQATRDAAHTACAGWMGELGQIDDQSEETCVHMQTGDAAWVGLVQSSTAIRPGDGWTWNGTTPLGFTDWQSGVPDDRDGSENGTEQCAKIQPDGTWDDIACSSSINFLCERP